MGELKPIGSEKLKGDEKIKRILELTYYQTNGNVNESTKGRASDIKETKTGVYGIEKERDGFYVKKGLNENSLDYIGGMFMKNRNRFSSHGEAVKKLNFLVEQEKSSEIISEATRYVLKQNKPASPIVPAAPPAEAPIDTPPEAPAPEGDVPMDNGFDDTEGDGGENPDDYMKVLQKMAGKLQQKINKYEDRLESADYKAVIKQILSAVDLNKLEESDKDDILSMFEDDIDPEAQPTGDFPTDNQGETPAPQETAEMGVDPIDSVDSLEELINTPLDEYGDDFGDDFSDDFSDDDGLSGLDDSFLSDPEISKASKSAEKDSGGEFSLGMNIDDIPTWEPKSNEFGTDDSDIDNDEFDDESLDETLPIQGMGEEDTDVELDLDELTNMVHASVKETLGKYFS